MGVLDAPPIRPKKGISVPTGWGLTWRAAKAEAGTRRVNVVGWGDSLTHGIGASNHRTTSWFGKLCTDLQALYGDGGSGFASVVQSTLWTVGQNAASVLWTFAGGTWTILYAGINDGSVYSSVVGATATCTGIRGTTVRLHYLTHPTYGTIEVRIDGVLVDTLVCTAAADQQYKDYAVAAGTHTLVVTIASGTSVIQGASGLNATGIVPWNMGHGGRTSAAVLRTSGFTVGKTNGTGSIRDQNPDLFLCEAIVNDAHSIGAGYDAATYAYNIRIALDLPRAYNSAADCMIVLPHIGTWELLDPASTGVYKWYDMASRLRGMADARGDAHVDFNVLGRNSWAYWNSLGYWGDATYTGASGTDQVHPSNAGHAFMADTILPLLVAA